VPQNRYCAKPVGRNATTAQVILAAIIETAFRQGFTHANDRGSVMRHCSL